MGQPVIATTFDNLWLSPIGSDALVQIFTADASSTAQDAAVEAAPDPYAHTRRSAEYRAAVSSCPLPHNGYDTVAYPAGYDLVYSYRAMLATVDGKFNGYSDQYASCMRRAGLRQRTYKDFSQIYTDLTAAAVGGVTSPKFVAEASYERRAVRADEACRRIPHNLAMAALAGPLQRFAATNAAILKKLRVEYAAIVRRANWYRAHPLRAH